MNIHRFYNSKNLLLPLTGSDYKNLPQGSDFNSNVNTSYKKNNEMFDHNKITIQNAFWL